VSARACVRVVKKQKRLSALYVSHPLPPPPVCPFPSFPVLSPLSTALSHTGMLEVADVMEKALQVLSLLALLYRSTNTYTCDAVQAVPEEKRAKNEDLKTLFEGLEMMDKVTQRQ